MDIPLELAFHNMAPSDGLKAATQRHLDRLERIYRHIVGCRVVIEMPHRSHRLRSNVPDVHILLRVPGREIIVSHEMAHAGQKKIAVDAYAVLREAFRAAQQRMKNYRRQQTGEVKAKSAPLPGHIVELVAERNYGFVADASGEQVYFSRDSVADGGFDGLKVGDTVAFAPVLSESGMAAGRIWRAPGNRQESPAARKQGD